MANKTVFLDRDGVINQEIGDYVYKSEQFKINKGVITFLKKVSKLNFQIIIVSNQGGVGRGRYTIADVELLHKKLLSEFEKEGIFIAEVYFCPHHPISSKCLCRKPESIMIEKAIARFNIDTKHSFLIGDAERDIEAAEKAGIKGIKIQANTNLNYNCEVNLMLGKT